MTRCSEPIADESNRIGTFGHGFTGGGHPVAAAVALENLKIIEERGLVGHAREVGAHMLKGLRELGSHDLVGEVRGVGLIAAIELVADKPGQSPWGKAGALGGLVALLQQNGVITRNMGDALAFCPPLIITKAQIDTLLAAVKQSLDVALKEVRADAGPIPKRLAAGLRQIRRPDARNNRIGYQAGGLIKSIDKQEILSPAMKMAHPSPTDRSPLRSIPPLSALQAFERAASQLSFRHAARDLALSPSAISPQIRGLEAQFGVKLFVRGARSVRLTAEGERYLEKSPPPSPPWRRPAARS